MARPTHPAKSGSHGRVDVPQTSTLAELAYLCGLETSGQSRWIKTRLKEAAPQVLAG